MYYNDYFLSSSEISSLVDGGVSVNDIISCGNAMPPDCAGVFGGDAVLDECGVCYGDNSTCLDCCGIPNGDGSTCDGACGACNDNTSCLDECGVINGNGPNQYKDCDGNCINDEDNDNICDEIDDDDDNDNVLDWDDSEPYNEFVCSDSDNDGCDDCSSGSYDTMNDGNDYDGDGICDDGDPDDDNDGCLDGIDCLDDCGAPNGDNSTCLDECGVPNGDNSTCMDECGIPNGDNSSCTDECGVINGDNSSCSDQCAVPNGPGYYYAYIDTDGDGIGEGEVIESCNDLTGSYCGSLSFNSGGWPEEVSWTITDNNSSEVASGNAGSNFELCLPTGDYTVNMYDSYGDGWNGNTLLYNGNSITLSSGSSGTSVLTVTNSDGNTNNYVLEGGDTEITGCTNSEADNYLSSANTDDGTCIISGCMDSNYAEYNENANTDDGSCSCPVSVELNVSDASCDLTDGSAHVTGLECNGMVTDPYHQELIDACLAGNGVACLQANSYSNQMYFLSPEMNYCFNNGDYYMCEEVVMMYPDEMASFLGGQSCYSWADSEGTLISDQESVSNLSAGTYTFTYNNGECSYSESFEVGLSCSGCTDSSAFNFNENANIDDSSCIAIVTGCMDATAFNFNPEANTSDDSCIPVVLGCIDNAYMEYDEAANTDDGSCVVIKVFGCMDDTPNLMSNYNPDANVDDGSCISWEQMVLDLESQLNNIVEDDEVGQADLDAVQGELTLALETIESLNAQISNVDLALTSEDLTYLTEFINGLLSEVSILLNSSELDLNAITGLSETYLTPAIDYLTENDLVSDDQVAMLYEILLQVGLLLGNQEDGIGQADVDAAYTAGAASVTPEDGIGQADVDAAYAAGAASVEIPVVELDTENIPLHLPQGWSMFGYTCIESVDVLGGFASISEKIEIVKDEWGLAYLPAWGFSAFENLEFGEGYQIKMMEEVTDFQFCSTITGYNTDNSVESNSNSLIGAWFIHSVYDLNTSTGVWESVDPYDIGAESIVIDAENVCFGQLSSCLPYFSPDNSNTLQFDEETAWLYSFGNEHIITGEAGNYLFMGENYVYEDGTFDNRFYIYIQP